MKRKLEKNGEDAVSPVVNVMLMLVVTIIIAAVVSGFAGGLINSQEATPSAKFDVSLTDDSIELKVQSISEDIPSKDLVIVLSKAGQTRKLVPGASTVPFGFNILEWADVTGFHDSANVSTEGISPTSAAHEDNSKQWFGNYTLKAGSRMSASHDAFTDLIGVPLPEGFTKGTYTKSEFYALDADQWTNVFGVTLFEADQGTDDWILKIKIGTEITNPSLITHFGTHLDANHKTLHDLWAVSDDHDWHFGQTIVYGDGNGGVSVSPGDSVTVTIVHSPSGQTMFMKTVMVKEG